MIKSGVFDNSPEHLHITLWRQSQGDKATAYRIIRDIALHYMSKEQVDLLIDAEIDTALGELNGGVEVEWLS